MSVSAVIWTSAAQRQSELVTFAAVIKQVSCGSCMKACMFSIADARSSMNNGQRAVAQLLLQCLCIMSLCLGVR